MACVLNMNMKLCLLLCTAVLAVPHRPGKFTEGVPHRKIVEFAVTEEQGAGPCCHSCEAPKNKYFSIADDSGPWLCGETCIRDSYYWIFHLFEKNLTKASSSTASVCKDNGYTHYNSTVTHGGGGLYCTLDLYACTRSGGCPHPDTFGAN